MKKKIMAMCLVIAMAATAVIGGTLAYFTDKDAETNVFTTGNVNIDLTENFEQKSKLMPVTYNADGTRNDANVVKKEVFVTNEGTEDAYVRVHIAIPTILDDGDPNFNASANTLHFNYDKESIGADKWDWSKVAKDAKYEGDWNFYKKNVNGIDYNVYVVTYEKALESGEQTVDAMSQVYLDSKVTNEQITSINTALNGNWNILVVAEGGQAAGFENAHVALNTQFGVPGSYNPFAN